VFVLETVQVHKQRGTHIASAHGQGAGAHVETRTNRVVVPEERPARQFAVHASAARTGQRRFIGTSVSPKRFVCPN